MYFCVREQFKQINTKTSIICYHIAHHAAVLVFVLVLNRRTVIAGNLVFRIFVHLEIRHKLCCVAVNAGIEIWALGITFTKH